MHWNLECVVISFWLEFGAVESESFQFVRMLTQNISKSAPISLISFFHVVNHIIGFNKQIKYLSKNTFQILICYKRNCKRNIILPHQKICCEYLLMGRGGVGRTILLTVTNKNFTVPDLKMIVFSPVVG